MIRDLTLFTGIAALAVVSIGALAYATVSHSTANSVTAARLVRVDAKPMFVGTNLRPHVRCLPTLDVDRLGVIYANRQCRT
jgi:hypothetical protein